ncbi:MAG: SUMF1/EgtB/PvdO family nonheme iron enzyme [Pseudomonadales bacterium]|nr:SUMF1/EgtB/PvdO family nonheme iron enzyme [Pseudomonadales bacterium]
MTDPLPPLNNQQHALLEQIQAGQDIDPALIDANKSQAPKQIISLLIYCLKRFSHCCGHHQLHQKFVKLDLLTDHGKDHQSGRFQKTPSQHPNGDGRFDDLLTLLEERDEKAMVLLGRPGCGKSTVLRHLELQLCKTALVNHDSNADLPFYEDLADDVELPFYVELNRYPSKDKPEQSPFEWLKSQWQARYPLLPPLVELMEQHPVLLLLDGLNEMRLKREQFSAKISEWKHLLIDIEEQGLNTRAVFSCRSLNYGGQLSEFGRLEVPQIQFADLDAEAIQSFIEKNAGPDWQQLDQHLGKMPGLETKTPYYLHLAVEHFKVAGLAAGPSALIAGMIWLSITREIGKNPAAIQAPFLLEKEQQRIGQGLWKKTPHALSIKGTLIPGLIQIAGEMQKSAEGNKQISLEHDTLLAELKSRCKDETESEALLTLAAAMDLMEHDLEQDQWKFPHQLMQEYLAGHHLNQSQNFAALEKPWQLDQVSETLAHKIQSLDVAAPLPNLDASGWEETALHCAAIADDQPAVIEQIEHRDLVLASRCARQPEVTLPLAQTQQLQQRLLQRSHDPQADLRARIEAGLELGFLGDPRFCPQPDKEHDFILPPLVTVAEGRYPMGSDQHDEDEKPAHHVPLESFSLGAFPITNAEWQCFMQAKGYQDPRWWPTVAAQQWREGTLENSGSIELRLNLYRALKKDFEGTCKSYSATESAVHEYQRWLKTWTESEFEQVIRKQFEPQIHRQPSEWDNPSFNNPAQPVVGVCWYEALAYCLWLSHQAERTFTLPSEAQWRAAAQGLTQRNFPWGAQFDPQDYSQPRANTDALHLRRTTPVGLLLEGATADKEGALYDLAGNVWEWTTSLYQDYPIEKNDSRDDINPAGPRVNCGGAWYSHSENARAGSRSAGPTRPSDRYDGIGFRVLSSPPSLGTEHR